MNGRQYKLLAQVSRNGFFFVLDRTNGQSLLSRPYLESANWYKGVDAKGQPIRDPEKDPQIAGSLVSPGSSGATNWPAPTFNPDTGLIYVGTSQTYMLDGRQYVIVGAGDSLYAFYLQ